MASCALVVVVVLRAELVQLRLEGEHVVGDGLLAEVLSLAAQNLLDEDRDLSRMRCPPEMER